LKRTTLTGPFTFIAQAALLLMLIGFFAHEVWQLFSLDHPPNARLIDVYGSTLLRVVVLGVVGGILGLSIVRNRRVTLVGTTVKIDTLFSRRTIQITQIRDVYWIRQFDGGVTTPEAAMVISSDGAEDETILFSPATPTDFETLRNRIPARSSGNLRLDN
jgi:hypothetical protein